MSSEEDRGSLVSSVRGRLCVLCGIGFALVYALRVNLSIAIVAMTKPIPQPLNNDTRCPMPPPSNSSHQGDFDWDAETQGEVLGAFFYGYVSTQILGGILADKYGAVNLLAGGLFCTSFFSLFTEVAARQGPWWLFALRLIEGLGEGVTFPAAASFWTRWSLPEERARLMGLSLAGSQIGNVLGIPLTGLIADNWGWPSVFYWFGAVGCLWCIAFFIYARNDPNDCPWITPEEKRLLMKSRPANRQEKRPIPWKKVFTCQPLLALAVAHASFNWGFYVLFTCLPKYMKEVLGFDLKHNAYYSALPYLTIWVFMNVSTQIGDYLLKKEIVRKVTVRKLFNTLSTFIPAILFTFIPFFGCDGISVVILICVCCMFKSGHYASVNVNHSDLAPPFTGLLFGITNMFANVPGILAPMLVGSFTKEESTIFTWSRVWYVSAAIYTFGALFYLVFGKAEVQPWARKKQRTSTNSDSEESDDTNQNDRQPLLASA